MEIMIIYPLWLLILLIVAFIGLIICVYLLGKIKGYKKCKQDYNNELEDYRLVRKGEEKNEK